MKTFLTFLMLAFFSVPLSSQANAADAVDTVRQALKNADAGMYTSTDQKLLSRLGDGSAFALVRIIGGAALRDSEIAPIMQLIKLSYESPQTIVDESNREPRATALLLRYLSLSSTDPQTKRKISETRQFVSERCKAAKVRDEWP